MSRKISHRISEFNKDRHPDYVHLKYRALTESPFRFFRGTCHVYHEDIPDDSFILNSPHTWISGDLHLENFGSFKGVHRLYFDMNDFDETFLGPCLIDIVRLCTSIYLISYAINFSKANCRKLIHAFLLSYGSSLQEGDAYFLEQQAATGFIQKFLRDVERHRRSDLLQKKVKANGKTRLRCDNIKTFKLDKATKKMVKAAIAQWVETNFADPEFFRVKDVVWRAAGTGSLGAERYMALINGDKVQGNFLLDIKEATPPSALHFKKFKQPEWKSHGHRITSVQRRVQAALPIFFSEIMINNKVFVMKEKQPEESKLNYPLLIKNMDKAIQMMHDMGAIVAWNSLRCGGRQGSAIADEMIKFGDEVPALENKIINYAEKYAAATVAYWKAFKKEYMPKQPAPTGTKARKK